MVDVSYLTFTSWLFQLETEGLPLRQVQDTLGFLPVVLSFGECMAITQERRSRSISTLMGHWASITRAERNVHRCPWGNPCQHSVLVLFLYLAAVHPSTEQCLLFVAQIVTFTGAEPLLCDVADLSCAAQRMSSKYEKWWQKYRMTIVAGSGLILRSKVFC